MTRPGLLATLIILFSAVRSPLPAQTLTSPVAVHGHGMINSVAWSPDGARFAFASNNIIQVFDSALAVQTAVMVGHTGYITEIAFSPDGASLASCAFDGTVRIWNAATGEQTRLIPPPASGYAEYTGLAFTPDGEMILVCSDGAWYRQWRVGDGELAVDKYGATFGQSDVKVSPDGLLIVVANESTTSDLFDIEGSYKGSFTDGVNNSNAIVAAFSPDGTKVALGIRGSAENVRVYSTATRQRLLTFTGLGSTTTNAVMWRDNESVIAVDFDGNGKYFRVSDGFVYASCTGVHQFPGTSGAALSPDGQTLLMGGSDALLSFWAPSVGFYVGGLQGSQVLYSGALNEDGTTAAWGGELGRIGVSGRYPLNVSGSVYGLAILPGGMGALAGATLPWNWSLDDPFNTALSYAGGPGVGVSSLDVAPDGQHFVTGGMFGDTHTWEVSDKTAPMQYMPPGVLATVDGVSWSPNEANPRIAVSIIGQIRLYQPFTAEPLGLLEPADLFLGPDVDFAPDGSRLTTTGYQDFSVRIISATDASVLTTLTGHTDYVRRARYDASGRWILTAGNDKTVRIWNAATGMPRKIITAPYALKGAEFSGDRTRIIAWGDAGSALVYQSGIPANGRAVGDFDESGCTDLGDFLFLLDNWQQVSEIGGPPVGLDDFLALLDNWQLGPECP